MSALNSITFQNLFRFIESTVEISPEVAQNKKTESSPPERYAGEYRNMRLTATKFPMAAAQTAHTEGERRMAE